MIKGFSKRFAVRETPISKRNVPSNSSDPPKVSKTDKKPSMALPAEHQPASGRMLFTSSIMFKKGGSSAKYYEGLNSSALREGSRLLERHCKVELRREINKNYRHPFVPPPKLTAKSYIIYEVKPKPQESTIVVSLNSKSGQEVASLTKIMTCMVVIETCQNLGVHLDQEEVVIGKKEANIGGTSACLDPFQIYTIEQLLFGLMLPSGNDASLALAVWCGRKLLHRDFHQKANASSKIRKETSTRNIDSVTLSMGGKITKSEGYNRFLQ